MRRRCIVPIDGFFEWKATKGKAKQPYAIAIKDGWPESTLTDLGQETLALTKMNWNSTQFDGSLPITIRAARAVGRVLKHVSAGALEAPEYRFYI
jgi:hypothetical protein